MADAGATLVGEPSIEVIERVTLPDNPDAGADPGAEARSGQKEDGSQEAT
jgi:hypothetical protein